VCSCGIFRVVEKLQVIVGIMGERNFEKGYCPFFFLTFSQFFEKLEFCVKERERVRWKRTKKGLEFFFWKGGFLEIEKITRKQVKKKEETDGKKGCASQTMNFFFFD